MEQRAVGARGLLAGGTASYTHGFKALVWLLGGKLQQPDGGPAWVGT